MNEENSKNTGNEFEIFWANFDPNHRWNEETKTFIRQLWEMIYELRVYQCGITRIRRAQRKAAQLEANLKSDL